MRLIRASKGKSEFLANIGHEDSELPMNGLLGIIDFCLAD